MRGIDGNYLNTQGDATARMQTAYQSEQGRQQATAQAQAADALRKLREQVNEAEKKDTSAGSQRIGDRPATGSGKGKAESGLGGGQRETEADSAVPAGEKGDRSPTHIDIRV